jgi:hypothetical protein
MLSCLHKHGLTREYLLRNLISFTADGVSNMLGRKKGFAALLVEMFLLNLTVNDVIREINEIYHMKRFFDKLYSLYSASPKTSIN